MEFNREIHEQYQKAYAQATMNQQNNKKRGMPVCPVVLDYMINERMISYRLDLGILMIPTSQIVGVSEEQEETLLYTKEFLPVSDPNSAYAAQWRLVYSDFVRSCGLCDEIHCLEYLGKFYVSDGLKRVSVAKFTGIPTMRAHVVRIMPMKTDSKEVELYFDFLRQYKLTGMYQLQFTQPGYFERLQSAVGKQHNEKWDENDRKAFLEHWPAIERAFTKSYADYLSITASDALVILLDKFTFSQLIRMDAWVLARLFQACWKEIYALSGSDEAAKPSSVFADCLQTA